MDKFVGHGGDEQSELEERGLCYGSSAWVIRAEEKSHNFQVSRQPDV